MLRNYLNCALCPRECGVNRFAARGACGEGYKIRIARAALHLYEEPLISGGNGSGTIFFSGCSLRCIYCQNAAVSLSGIGSEITPYELSEIFKRLEGEGAHNISLVTADHFAVGILDALELYKPGIPVVYNCSGYQSVNTLSILKGAIDVYLPDFKYGLDSVGAKYSGVTDYVSVARSALAHMRDAAGVAVTDKGLLKRGVLVRHMVLPSEMHNSRAALDIIAEIMGETALGSLMSQYTPNGLTQGNLARTLKPVEYKLISAHARKLNLNNFYLQELSSATNDYLPQFT